MNPPINITNYDKRRANSERGGNLGLADLSLEELKTILLERKEAMGLWRHPGGLLKISSTLPSCNVVVTFLFHHTTIQAVILYFSLQNSK